jgi:hypothetical protein
LAQENLSGAAIREEIRIENEVIFLIDHPGRV